MNKVHQEWRETHGLIYAGDVFVGRAFDGKQGAKQICKAHNAELADTTHYYETVRYRGLINHEARLADELSKIKASQSTETTS